MNNIFRFQYFTKTNNPLLHQMRDVGAFIEILPILNNNGFHYKDVFLNHPNPNDKQKLPLRIRQG